MSQVCRDTGLLEASLALSLTARMLLLYFLSGEQSPWQCGAHGRCSQGWGKGLCHRQHKLFVIGTGLERSGGRQKWDLKEMSPRKPLRIQVAPTPLKRQNV